KRRRFLKKAWQKLSDASRKAGAKANNSRQKPKLVITPFCNLSHNNTATRPVNVNQIVLYKRKALIKLQTGQAPSRLPGVQGGGQPPCSKALRVSQSLSKALRVSQNLSSLL
ncbi:MAG: hypothetical protein ACI4J7_09960, partial [Ruminiclostridium sp.]